MGLPLKDLLKFRRCTATIYLPAAPGGQVRRFLVGRRIYLGDAVPLPATAHEAGSLLRPPRCTLHRSGQCFH
jgi:hypothetical protein